MIGGTKQKTDKTRCSVSQIFPSGVGWNHKQRNWGDKISYITSNRGGSELTLKLYYRPVTVANKTTAYHPITSQKQWPHQPVSTSVFSFSTVSLRFSRFLPFSAPEEPQWWEISPSCQHFNGIKECVNQSTSSSKMEPPPPSTLVISAPVGPSAEGLIPNVELDPQSQTVQLIGSLLCPISNMKAPSPATTCSPSLWMLFLLAINTYMATAGPSWFCPDFVLISSKYFWIRRDVSLGDTETAGPAGSAPFCTLTSVANAKWRLLMFHLRRSTKK